MSSDRRDIDVGLSLADSELISYFYQANANKLIVEIQAYNLTIIQFDFHNIIHFVDHGTLRLSNVCENTSRSNLLDQAFAKHYVIMPEPGAYKLIEFLNVEDDPTLEVVCERWEAALTPPLTT